MTHSAAHLKIIKDVCLWEMLIPLLSEVLTCSCLSRDENILHIFPFTLIYHIIFRDSSLANEAICGKIFN